MSNTLTRFGNSALANNTTGFNNSAFGHFAAYNNTDASCNTAIGACSSFYNVHGEHNTAIGAGSMCNNVNHVISFIPQTIIKNPINLNYSNLKNIINKNTKYILYGNKGIKDKNNLHHILHCENIECFTNVKIIKNNNCNLKELRDNGFIKNTIDDIIFSI